jgi:L-asparaginase
MASLITLLTTGGTVATTSSTETGRSAPTAGPAELAALAAVEGVTVQARSVRQEPSWALDLPAMAGIAIAAMEAAREPGIDGVVLTHGTTTLEYTAFLTSLLVVGSTPVVFTGAMRHADDAEPDGPGNLRDAIRVASSRMPRAEGVLVVFAGRILAGRRAWKARRVDVDAFVDTDGQIGSVVDGEVTLDRMAPDGAGLSGRLETNVAFLKVLPGANGRVLERALADEPAGIVVEGLPGVGGVPPGMQPALIAAARDRPVVLASRAPFGRLPETVSGGTGEPFREAGLWSAGGLTAEQAWILLMATLGEGWTREETRRRFHDVALGALDRGLHRRDT